MYIPRYLVSENLIVEYVQLHILSCSCYVSTYTPPGGDHVLSYFEGQSQYLAAKLSTQYWKLILHEDSGKVRITNGDPLAMHVIHARTRGVSTWPGMCVCVRAFGVFLLRPLRLRGCC